MTPLQMFWMKSDNSLTWLLLWTLTIKNILFLTILVTVIPKIKNKRIFKMLSDDTIFYNNCISLLGLTYRFHTKD